MKDMFLEVRHNNIKSWIMIFIFILFLAVLGTVFGLLLGDWFIGLIFAVSFAVLYTIIAYKNGDEMVLKTLDAKEATKSEYPYLFHTVEGLSIAAGIPKPKAYVIEDTALNAFATGRDPKHASVTVTTGLLEKMNRQELEGVLAHEMSHIKNYDIRVMMLAAVLVGAIVLLSDVILRSFLWGGYRTRIRSSRGGNITVMLIALGVFLAVFTPLIGELIKLSISRKREYMADANAAILTRYPPGLASALRKIKNDPDPRIDKANKATAHLFISSPFQKKPGFVERLFSTHPPIEERIKRLMEM
jgi:heat shock protein HtpX